MHDTHNNNYAIKFYVISVQNQQVYRTLCDKPPLAARCCHVANDLINSTVTDRRTNERTDKQKDIAIS